MARTPKDVTDAELRVLQALWEKGPATIRQLTDVLYPEGNDVHYATVQKLLERLEAKGCVRVDRGGAVLTFTPALSREELISRRLLDVADRLCGGSLTPLLLNLVRAKPLSAAELNELRSALDALQREPRARKKSR